MSVPIKYPENHINSLPHIRLKKTKYIVLENKNLYSVKIESGHSYLALIAPLIEIQKVSVLLINGKYGNHVLHFIVFPKNQKKKDYLIRPIDGMRLSSNDWGKIEEFINRLGFKPDPKRDPNEKLMNSQSAVLANSNFEYFHQNDKIYQIYEDPIFMKDRKSIYLSPFAFISMFVGYIGLCFPILFAIIGEDGLNTTLWIILGISLLLLGYGTIKWIIFRKKKKLFMEKYDVEYYFR